MQLTNKKIIVCGASSMLGKEIIDQLRYKGAIIEEVFHHQTDLLSEEQTFARFSKDSYDICINCAGYNGSIMWNAMLPYTILYRTSEIGFNVTSACCSYKVPHLYNLLTSCSYPTEFSNEPLKEEMFLSGIPHDSVSCHAYSKRNWMIAGQNARKQYNLKVLGVVFNNCYGEEKFDEQKTKVAGALVKRFVDAKKKNLPEIVLWGSGKARRELLYFRDAAQGLIRTIESEYDNESLPILNVGSGNETTILELAELIKTLTEFKGNIKWDITKPEGQTRKVLDNSRMKQILNWIPSTPLEKGLKETIDYYNYVTQDIVESEK